MAINKKVKPNPNPTPVPTPIVTHEKEGNTWKYVLGVILIVGLLVALTH